METALVARPRDERGVTMILVAMVVAVLVAMAALVVDVGAMLQERRELQNGADAAALALAHSCALGEAACTSNAAAAGAAAPWANGNALDAAMAVDAATVNATGRTVEVKTSTRTSSGGTIVPFNFGQAVTGQTGEHLRAKATASWATLGGATTIPLTLSRCEFEAAGFDTGLVAFHVGTQGRDRPDPCNSGPAGTDIPGGFGWLDATADGCEADYDAGDRISANTGVAISGDCVDRFEELLGKKVLVPIYGDFVGTGTIATYEIVGFGEFLLTGYRFPSVAEGDPVPCRAPATCIGGQFVRFVTNSGSSGGEDFGAYVIKLVS